MFLRIKLPDDSELSGQVDLEDGGAVTNVRRISADRRTVLSIEDKGEAESALKREALRRLTRRMFPQTKDGTGLAE